MSGKRCWGSESVNIGCRLVVGLVVERIPRCRQEKAQTAISGGIRHCFRAWLLVVVSQGAPRQHKMSTELSSLVAMPAHLRLRNHRCMKRWVLARPRNSFPTHQSRPYGIRCHRARSARSESDIDQQRSPYRLKPSPKLGRGLFNAQS